MSEILTFQLGSFSNYIGCHFWNIQQEQINNDVCAVQNARGNVSTGSSDIVHEILFSEHVAPGLSEGGSLQPRLVIADLNGALGGSVLLETPTENTSYCWDGKVTPFEGRAPSSLKKHPYATYLDESSSFPPAKQQKQKKVSHRNFDFENTVKHFSDFFMPVWNPVKHVECIPNRFYGTDDFSFFPESHEYCPSMSESGSGFWENLTDKFRWQFELADSPSAVHLLFDWYTGFGGLGTSTLDWLRLEAPKMPLLIFGNQAYDESMSAPSPGINGTACIARGVWAGGVLKHFLEELAGKDNSGIIFSDYNTLPQTTGLQQPLVPKFDLKSFYTASSMAGVALDCMTLPYRVGRNITNPRYMFESVTRNGNEFGPLMSLHIACPAPPDLISANSVNERKKFISNMWDVSKAPAGLGGRERAAYNTRQHSTSFWSSRGLSYDQEINLVSCLSSSDIRFCHPNPTPLPIPFPQLFYSSMSSPVVAGEASTISDITHISTLTSLQAVTDMHSSRVVESLDENIKRALKCGPAGSAIGRWDMDRDMLVGLHQYFRQMLADSNIAEDDDVSA